MSQPIDANPRSLPERIRAIFGRRAAGIILALLVEALLGILLLTLAPSIQRDKEVDVAVFTFGRKTDALPAAEPATAKPTSETTDPRPPERAEPRPADPAETPPQPPAPAQAPPPTPLIRLSPDQMAAADISTMAPRATAPATARRRPMGPPDTGGSGGDTAKVEGTGPNGEPLYAASWYRKPYDDELRGFLSTARGPGWGMIACRTVRDFRVEDCVIVDEYPDGSNIARSVLAAAWQFRVRPPQLGGQSRIGEWVRIRIDYETRGP